MHTSSKSELPKLSLQYLLRKPKTAISAPPFILLLHGFGSNEADLFDLADDIPPEFLVISVRAPRVLAEGQYAWFDLDFLSGEPIHDKVQAEESRHVLKRFIDEVVKEFPVDTSRIFLIGFSQGAIMSASVALTHPTLVKGIGLLSGRILEEIKPHVAATRAIAKLKVFLAHGILDHVLPIRHAREAKAYLEELGVDLTYNEYPIPHAISRHEQIALLEWLMTPEPIPYLTANYT